MAQSPPSDRTGGHVLMRRSTPADRDSRNASLTLGITLPTDTVLYLLLPLYPDAIGVSLAEAGFLLAANRLVRMAGYGWVAGLYERRGPRASCIAAVIGAARSSLRAIQLQARFGRPRPRSGAALDAFATDRRTAIVVAISVQRGRGLLKSGGTIFSNLSAIL